MNEPLFVPAIRRLALASSKIVVALGDGYVSRRHAPAAVKAKLLSREMDVALLSKAELAEKIGVTIRTLDTWMKDRRIPYLQIWHSVRF